ncbi:MAG TPA: hypothetical protein VII06_10770 [Chloroflexota bacterium]
MQERLLDDRTREAVTELQAAIRTRYPSAVFELTLSPGDPHSLHLNVIVDLDDPDEVVELQAEEGIPIHVIPLRTPERIAAARQEQLARGARRARKTALFGGATA